MDASIALLRNADLDDKAAEAIESMSRDGATSGRMIEIDGERVAVSTRVAAYIGRLRRELAASEPAAREWNDEELVKVISACFLDSDLDTLGRANAARLIYDIGVALRRLASSQEKKP